MSTASHSDFISHIRRRPDADAFVYAVSFRASRISHKPSWPPPTDTLTHIYGGYPIVGAAGLCACRRNNARQLADAFAPGARVLARRGSNDLRRAALDTTTPRATLPF